MLHDLASRLLWTIIDNHQFVGERVQALLRQTTIDAATKRRRPTKSRYYNTQLHCGSFASRDELLGGCKNARQASLLGDPLPPNAIDQVCQRPGLSILSTSSLTSEFHEDKHSGKPFGRSDGIRCRLEAAHQMASYSAAICCTVLSTASSTTAVARSSRNLVCRSRYSFQA